MPAVTEDIEWASPDSVGNCLKEIKTGGTNVSFGWCEPKLGESGEMLEELCTLLTKSKKIQALDLENANLSDSAVEELCNALKKNKSLRVLVLTGNDLGASAGKAIEDMLKLNKTLKTINLAGNPRIPAWHMEAIENVLKTRE
jgi:Ran GTPase-activating protein (RanGAP) involved in mRNA processing and transport